jgi:MFS family permease
VALYAAWTWLPAFISASIGCVWGGLVADRRGRAWLVTLAMALSGACALGIGLAFGTSLWLLVPVALMWGFCVIAESAQFSVLVTESVPPDAVGTALTLQTSLGFLLTTVTISAVPVLHQRLGWPLAFGMLALGPAAGIACMRRLARRGAEPVRA